MRAARSIARGLRQALAAPKLILLLWLVNLIAVLPATLMMASSIEEDLGESLFADSLAERLDTDWLAERDHRAQGIATTFTPPRLFGKGVVLENLDKWMSGSLLTINPAITAFALLYALVWIVLQGGVLDRLAQPQVRFTPQRFFAASGRYAPRLAVLAAMAGIVYYLVYRGAGLVFGRLEEASRDVPSEGTVFGWVLAATIGLVLVLQAVRLVFDFAKIAIVIDDVRMAPKALWIGLRFVLARPLRTVGVYAGVGILSLALMALYALLAPGAGQNGWLLVVLALVLSQLFVIGRLFLRVSLLGAALDTYRATGGT